ncbi:unnamed protein product [Somion occarium]|uniref:Uncharacterized protein n=1 Tax=Somion occarium TaxID=3059160 RepID=A0ABP1E9V8_9APHY
MFSKSHLSAFLSALVFSDAALGRYQWLERDGRHVALYPRRFAQEHPAVIDKLSAACSGGICATLAGQAITPLLAAQPECSQQDMADTIIDTAQQFDDTTKALMIELAKEYRQAEKNTPPDFTTNPPTNRNSVFCQKAPKNAELNGLVQAQDPANDPDLFFDPATQQTVKNGSQANTFPFGSSGSSSPGDAASSTVVSSTIASSAAASSVVVSTVSASASASSVVITSAPGETFIAEPTASSDPCVVTVTVTASATFSASSGAITVTAGDAASTTAAAPSASSTAAVGDIGDFGSCSVPRIEFGVGFDNRKETSFEPTSYDHGSAQNVDIIAQFICDTLVNKCGADQTAKDTCAKAQAAADTVTAKTGGQADAFNAVFGIDTDFADVASVDDQGRVVAGTGNGNNAVASASAASTTAAAASPTSSAASGSTGTSSAIGNFGTCSVPKIEFAAGFDNRKETSFQPADKTSFNHGSAQNIDIITQFICDTLTNSCAADQTAKDTCQKARAAADTETAKTGAQADAFNEVFGVQTDFASVDVIDDQGNVVSAAGGAVSATQTAAGAPSSSKVAATATSTSAAAPTATSQAAAATSDNLQTFTSALGGVKAPVVTDLGGGKFQVEGNSQFNNLANALTRSCDVQHNQCANAANASGNKGDLTVAACGDQQTQCNAAH